MSHPNFLSLSQFAACIVGKDREFVEQLLAYESQTAGVLCEDVSLSKSARQAYCRYGRDLHVFEQCFFHHRKLWLRNDSIEDVGAIVVKALEELESRGQWSVQTS